MYQLRKYTLKDRESLDFFRNVIYPRHFGSFAKFGMAIHGLWTAPDPNDLTFYVLFSFPEQDDPAAVLAELVKSKEFRADVVDWDGSNILGYTDTFMAPSTASPLR
ncbi:NIPSNAP domain-containing protein [Mycobacterium sp.]|uniref:NIPSNAP domain-containing protein n=1 Tax=Mycobacterium sp. TaxID=1785 RepID=UPI003C7328A2